MHQMNLLSCDWPLTGLLNCCGGYLLTWCLLAGGRARVMYNFTFSSSKGLQLLNPYLAPSDYAGVPSGSSCTNKDLHCYEKVGSKRPAAAKSGFVLVTHLRWTCPHCSQVSLFSGLAPSPRSTPSELRMIGITDRGPNGDCAKSSDKSFPVPSFSPSIFELRANKLTGAIEMVSNCYLKDSTGAPITGERGLRGSQVPQAMLASSSASSCMAAYMPMSLATGRSECHCLQASCRDAPTTALAPRSPSQIDLPPPPPSPLQACLISRATTTCPKAWTPRTPPASPPAWPT
jgi:hypothetical protein